MDDATKLQIWALFNSIRALIYASQPLGSTDADHAKQLLDEAEKIITNL